MEFKLGNKIWLHPPLPAASPPSLDPPPSISISVIPPSSHFWKSPSPPLKKGGGGSHYGVTNELSGKLISHKFDNPDVQHPIII